MATLNPLGLDDLVDNAIPAIQANFVALNAELVTKETPSAAQAKADAAQAAAVSAAATSAESLYAPTSHVHPSAHISDSTTVGRALLTAASAAAARTAIGAGTSNFDGSYNSLANLPALFDGSWASLSGKPTLFDGSWASLTGKPTLGYFATGTDAANLSGSIPRALFPAGAGLQVLRLNSAGTGFEFVTITAGGGDMSKSENLAGLTDYAQARTYLGLGSAALQSTSAFAAAAHNHDSTYAALSHSHPAAQISDSTATGRALITAADAAAARTAIGAGTSSFSGAYSSLSGIPGSFTPDAHNHAISDITSLQTALDNKQALHTELTAILAVLTGTGYLRRTGPGTYVLDTPAGGGGSGNSGPIIGDASSWWNAAGVYKQLYGGSVAGRFLSSNPLVTSTQGGSIANYTGYAYGVGQTCIALRTTGASQNPGASIGGSDGGNTTLRVKDGLDYKAIAIFAIRLPALSDATDTFRAVVSWDNEWHRFLTHDLSIHYIHSEAGGNWQIRAIGTSGGSETYTTGITVAANTTYILGLEIDARNGKARFYDLSTVGASTLLYETVAVANATETGFMPLATIRRTAGTTARDMVVLWGCLAIDNVIF